MASETFAIVLGAIIGAAFGAVIGISLLLVQAVQNVAAANLEIATADREVAKAYRDCQADDIPPYLRPYPNEAR